MSEASAHPETAPGNVGRPCAAPDTSDPCAALDARLELLAAAAATLPDRLPRVRDPIAGRRVAKGAHLLLANLANGRRALDVAIAEGLYALSLGDRCLQVNYASSNDYAREVLGIPASTAEKLTRFGKRLRDRPIIREALRSGELSLRKAELLAQVARPGDEMRLVMMAKGETVRSLRARLAAPDDSPDEEWLNLSASVAPGKMPVVQKGLRVAGKFLRPGASKMERLEIMGQEFLGSHAAPEDDRADDVYFAADEGESLEAELERQNRGWADLERGEPMRAPELEPTTDAGYIDAWLKAQARKRELWDDTFGRVALMFYASRAWGLLGFRNFGHYCEEGLGMSERAVAQRISLERSLQRMPPLRQALRERRINYEKARVLARHADADSLPALIEKATGTTCIALRRDLEEKEEAQMCARNTVSVWMTVRVADLVKAAFRAARALAKRWLAPGECLVTLTQHFVKTWGTAERAARTLHQRILARDRHFCQVPGCSRAAVHAHHIIFRSQGGTDDPSNLVSICAAHHLRGIHGGLLRVTGSAPDGLVWEFGLKRGYLPANCCRRPEVAIAAVLH
jgi:hypothetical protein